MEPILELKNVSKQYRDFALENVSFTLPKGSIMGFIGENGAGKTTTLKLILNQLHRSTGSITVFGQDNILAEKQVKEEIGVVPDEIFFNAAFTPRIIARVLGASYRSWDDALFTQYLTRFKLPASKTIKEYSRGMKMKLSIAAALAHKPKLLLLDEATSGLDPVVRGEILDVFLDFIQDEEHGILLSSHITSDLERIADYITFIQNGKIVLSESKDEILESYGMVRCTKAQLAAIAPEYLLGSVANAYGCNALVKNKNEVARRCPGLALDAVTLDDIMVYYAGGNEQ